MKRHLISSLALVVYGAVLVKVMVFKDIPMIRVGQLMLNFGGTDVGHAPNFVPFVTIVPYLLGHKGLLIAGINLVGNIVLLIPVGFLLPLVYRGMTWKKSLAVAAVVPLVIETMQTVLRVGIFDIDDVILNALGVMIGYWTFRFLSKWVQEKQYINIVVAAVAVIAIIVAAFYFVYPWGQPVNTPRPSAGDQFNSLENQQQEDIVTQTGDLCGGTGGIGEVLTIGNNEFTLKLKNDSELNVKLAARATIETLAGSGSLESLKVGNRVTLVGGPNPDGSFTADNVFVCSGSD
jgi:glycopeptide antibiotics resistance protein